MRIQPKHACDPQPVLQPARVLIVGAGAAGRLLHEALDHERFMVVGFVDDDPLKQGSRLLGVPVLGAIQDIAGLVRQHAVTQLVIAIPSASGSQMLHILIACVNSRIPFRSVPDATPSAVPLDMAELQQVTLDSLLARGLRDPVLRVTCEPNAGPSFSGRVVMVTGAAGSVGSQLVRELLTARPAKLICVDQAETPLFYLQHSLSCSPHTESVFALCDFSDVAAMRRLFSTHRVDAVFHAAAYKHVSMVEASPAEGIRNNVLAFHDLVQVAEETGCRDLLLVSTDKAVNPSSIMGCTKRLGELIVASMADSPMRCMSVRFGNVLGSQGSVVPLFRQQILNGEAISVNHPEMTRYFLTIPEAASLVLHAFTRAKPGETLVLDTGRPARIVDLANLLVSVLGRTSQATQMVYTGIQTGEKLHEELFYQSELPMPTDFPEILRIKTTSVSRATVSRWLSTLHELASIGDAERIREALQLIIPEYRPSSIQRKWS